MARQGRKVITDDQFYASLGGIRISRDAAIRVRSVAEDAVRIQPELISASDKVLEVQRVGGCTHGSIVDYFTDLLWVEEPKVESDLVTMQDLVIQFGPQMLPSGERHLT